jgi:hypothetical protein
MDTILGEGYLWVKRSGGIWQFSLCREKILFVVTFNVTMKFFGSFKGKAGKGQSFRSKDHLSLPPLTVSRVKHSSTLNPRAKAKPSRTRAPGLSPAPSVALSTASALFLLSSFQTIFSGKWNPDLSSYSLCQLQGLLGRRSQPSLL